MPSRLVSVSTFADPRVQAPVDPRMNPTQAVTYWLRRDIVRGVFEPMERLKVEHLSKYYDVGHSPVREAILLLSPSGLVIHEHQKGYRVAPMSLEDYDDVVDVYQRIYHLALTMAVERGGEAWEERVVLALHRSLKVEKVMLDAAPEARELWQQAYKNLHLEMVSGCESPLLLGIFRNLGDRAERYVNLFADLSTDRMRDSHSEHRAIVDALVSRDADRLRTLVHDFFEGGQPMRRTIIEQLRRESAPRVRAARSGAATRKLPAKRPARGATARPKRGQAAGRD